MTTLAILCKARELVARDGGWAQHSYKTKDGALCATGAIEEAQKMRITPLKYLRDAVGNNNVISWNDAKCRTQSQVVAAFDRAIELAKKEKK